MRRWTMLVVLAAGAAALGDAAADRRHQHGAHEHGKVTVNVALDGTLLAIELEAPAVNVVGFERAPRTEAEQAAARAAAALLESGRGLVGVPRGALCRLEQASLEAPQWSGDSGGHAEYHARYRYRCRNPQALDHVELWLLRHLRDLGRAQVNVVSATTQTTLALQPPAARVPLR